MAAPGARAVLPSVISEDLSHNCHINEESGMITTVYSPSKSADPDSAEPGGQAEMLDKRRSQRGPCDQALTGLTGGMGSSAARESERRLLLSEHDPEKWIPVSRLREAVAEACHSA
jgi:hypothetical protein